MRRRKYGYVGASKRRLPPFVMGLMKTLNKKQFALITSLLLSACSTNLSERVPCPTTAILAEFSKTIDLTQVEPIRSEMDSLTPICTRDGNVKNVEIRLRITSIRPLKQYHHPLTHSRSYFVAVVDKAGNVISRSDHTVEVKFEEKQTHKVSYQELIEKVPSGKDVTIYVGFNLDEAEMAHLQAERTRKLH
jgi:hypothetical protein